MSTFEIKMPKLGESITQGTIMRWAVKVGDTVEEDDVLFEVSTEKVSAEIPSPVAGKVIEIRFAENDIVPVGTVMAIIETASNTSVSATATATDKMSPAVPEPSQNIPSATAISETQDIPAAKKDKSGRFYSPLVRNIAQVEKITDAELESIQGTGFQGRVTKADVLQFLKETPAQSSLKEKEKVLSPESVKSNAPISTESTESQELFEKHSSPPRMEESQCGASTIIPMDHIRRIIADHMVMSKNVSAHVSTFVDVDVTRLVQWRERNKDEFFRRTGVKLTYMPAIIEASAKALIEFPRVNASVDGYNIILKKQINVGMAVALDDGNLIVPVIHDADKLNVNGLGLAVDSLAAKARNNKLSPDDIQGGTFTITNFGTFKNIFGTPIINQPQVAILGVGYIEKRPAVMETPDGDMIAIRHKMYLSLSYDHRIVDGALGGAFLRRIADYLEQYE